MVTTIIHLCSCFNPLPSKNVNKLFTINKRKKFYLGGKGVSFQRDLALTTSMLWSHFWKTDSQLEIKVLIGYRIFACKKGSKEQRWLGESSTLPTLELYDVLNFSDPFSSLTKAVFMLEQDKLFSKESIHCQCGSNRLSFIYPWLRQHLWKSW